MSKSIKLGCLLGILYLLILFGAFFVKIQLPSKSIAENGEVFMKTLNFKRSEDFPPIYEKLKEQIADDCKIGSAAYVLSTLEVLEKEINNDPSISEVTIQLYYISMTKYDWIPITIHFIDVKR